MATAAIGAKTGDGVPISQSARRPGDRHRQARLHRQPVHPAQVVEAVPEAVAAGG